MSAGLPIKFDLICKGNYISLFIDLTDNE